MLLLFLPYLYLAKLLSLPREEKQVCHLLFVWGYSLCVRFMGVLETDNKGSDLACKIPECFGVQKSN